MTLRASGLASNFVLSGACAALLVFTGGACSSEDPNIQCPTGSGGAAGSGGEAPGSGGDSDTGGQSSSGGKSSGSGGQSSSGGKSSGSGGQSNTGGKSGGSGGGGVGGDPSSDWSNAATPDDNVGCVSVNRLTGDVFTQVTGGGIHKSTNQGSSWTRVDGGKVGGVCVMGPALDIDQENPVRLAAWSLDGDAGWTNDGVTWKRMQNQARNWDMGSTDWAAADPKIMIAARHEAGGETFLSTDGATTFTLMNIIVNASPGPPPHAMVGVMDDTTLIYSEGSPGGGIQRSTNTGSSFTKVSDFDPKTRVPVLFNGVHYLGTGEGLIVSTDLGATWQRQGTALDMWVGPFFGADENEIMVANNDGVYLSFNAGDSWTKVATIPTSRYNPQVLGSFAWDHIGKVLYAAAIEEDMMKLEL